MKNNSELTSRELEKLLKISADTLKHWRYGYYTGAGGKKMFYRDDHIGVPCELKDAGQYQYYIYSLEDVHKWISSWKTQSSKKNYILSTIERAKEE